MPLHKKQLLPFLFAILCLACLGDDQKKLKNPWKDAEELFPGILRIYEARVEPRLMKMSIVRVDVSKNRYGFFTAPKPENYGEKMPDCDRFNIVTKRQSTRNFLIQANEAKKRGGYGLKMVLAVNASPWSPWEAPFNHKYAARLGLLIAQGEVLDGDDLGRPSFVVKKDGSLDFRNGNNNIPIEDIYIAVSGFSTILEKGEVTPGARGDTSLAPRTGYGLSKDKRFFYILIIDGRQENYSMGANTGEMGEIMKQYGAYTALNMDGGGSTTLVIREGSKKGENGKSVAVKKLNHQPGDAERNNGSNLGIFIK